MNKEEARENTMANMIVRLAGKEGVIFEGTFGALFNEITDDEVLEYCRVTICIEEEWRYDAYLSDMKRWRWHNVDKEDFNNPSLQKPIVLMEAIHDEIERIFPEGDGGSAEELEWLSKHYGVTEKDNDEYLEIVEAVEAYYSEDDSQIDIKDICLWLFHQLRKYQSNDEVFLY